MPIPISARQSRCGRFIYTGDSFVPKISVSAGKTVKLLWGDGEITTVDGPVVETEYTHNYGSSDVYAFKIMGDLDGLTKFQYVAVALSGDLSGVRLLTSLDKLYVYDSSVSGNISNVRGLTALEQLGLISTGAIGNILHINGLTVLRHLHLHNTALIGDIAVLNGMPNLQDLNLYNSSISDYTQGALPDWDICTILINDLGLSQQEVDDFLGDLDTASTASTKTLNIHGTNAAPSATGLASKTSLEGKGWTVNVSS